MNSIGIIAVVIIFANVFGEDFLHTCPSGEVLCGDRKKCVATSAICDYVQDCEDLSDETNLNLCKKIREPTKCDQGMIACNDFTVPKKDENINTDNNNNNRNDYDYYYHRRYTTTTTTTTTEPPPLSRYPFLSNQCLDIITACLVGKDCLGDDHSSLCQEIIVRKLSGLGTKIFSTSTDIEDMYTLLKDISVGLESISNGSCPYFHTLFKGNCFWELPVKTTWHEAKEICESIGSSLAVVQDLNTHQQIRNFIKNGPIGTNFWIGGSHTVNSDGSSETWKWIDGSEMANNLMYWALRSPFWNRSSKMQGEKLQANKVNDGKCVAILSENYYLFSNEDCNLRFSPLCIKKADIKPDVKADIETDVGANVEADVEINVEADPDNLNVGTTFPTYAEDNE